MPAGYRTHFDGSLNTTQATGQNVFLNTPIDGGVLQCAFCHKLPIGTDGFSSFEGEPQEFKIPHLRNLYQKVGTFGVPPGTQAPATGFLGDQVRGFGFLHDGSIDSVFDFLHVNVFAFFHEHDHELERGDDYDHELDHDDDAPLSRAEVPHDHDDGNLTGVKLGS